MFLLEVAGSHIVDDGPPEYVVQCVLSFRSPAFSADDHRHLPLVIGSPGGVVGKHDCIIRTDDRSRGFGEDHRMLGNHLLLGRVEARPGELVGVVVIIAANGEYVLANPQRGQQPNVGQWHARTTLLGDGHPGRIPGGDQVDHVDRKAAVGGGDIDHDVALHRADVGRSVDEGECDQSHVAGDPR